MVREGSFFGDASVFAMEPVADTRLVLTCGALQPGNFVLFTSRLFLGFPANFSQEQNGVTYFLQIIVAITDASQFSSHPI